MMNFETLIAGLASHFQLPDLIPDANNRCVLVFDDVPIDIYAEKDDSILILTGNINYVEIDNVVLLEWLLYANLMGFGTGGGRLAMQQDGMLTLTIRPHLASLSIGRLLNQLETLVRFIENWREWLSNPGNYANSAISGSRSSGCY